MFDPWVRKIPRRRKWQPTPVLLPGKSHGWWNLVGYSPWGHKKSNTTKQPHFHFEEFIQRNQSEQVGRMRVRKGCGARREVDVATEGSPEQSDALQLSVLPLSVTEGLPRWH